MKIANQFSYSLVLLLSTIIADISILLNIPICRQVFGFLLVTFIPGSLITCILFQKPPSPSKTVLYSIGFSVALSMFLGFLVNLIGPQVGIDRPISIVPLLLTVNIAVITLLIITFFVNHSGYKSPIDFKESFVLFFSPQGLFLLLILLLGILGGFAVRYYIFSIFSVVVMFLLALVVSLIAFDKFFEEKHYSLTLFIISLTLLFNYTLTSPYLAGTDIHIELFFQKLTEINGYWDPTLYPNALNAMLSTVILPTVYSLFLGIDIIFVYKVIFSILFALVPVALYHVFKELLEPKFSFFSAFLFISFYAFFAVLTWLPRQQIAEFYLALLLLTLFEKHIHPTIRGVLTITWIASLVVSHYATTYITLFFMIFVLIMLFVFRQKSSSFKLSTTVVAVILTFSWYIYISSSQTLETMVEVGHRIFMAVGGELFSSSTIDPTVDTALGIGLFDLPFWHLLGHLWQIGTQILIIIGFAYVILRYFKKRSTPELTFLSVAGMLFLLMSITLPFFASSLNMDRVYHIVLMIISPLCVFGVIYLMDWFSRIYKINNIQKQKLISICLVVVCVPYFLFNSGSVFEVTEKSNNLFLNINRTVDHSRYFSNSSYYFLNQIVPREDVVASQWISTFKTTDSPVYADSYRECELWGYGLIPINEEIRGLYPPMSGGYVFVGRQNIIDDIYVCRDPNRVRSTIEYKFDQIRSDLDPRNLVYSSGAAIYNLN